MRSILLILIGICSFCTAQAQIYEVGVLLGRSNFIGDVGSTKYIAPRKVAAGALVKWNRSPRHSFRASVLFTQLVGEDLDSSDPRRKARGYAFSNDIVEFSAGMEFTFLDFDLNSLDPQMTPYLYTGISTARHKDSFFDANGDQIFENTNSWAYGIPMVLGFKATIGHGLIAAAEVGVRYTTSDKIDGSLPDNPANRENYSFGNLNSNDWYVFSGITLTYTFGQKPCYCY